MTDPISNERLAEMLAEVEIEFDNALSDAEADQNPQLAVDPVGEFDLVELRSILTELQSRRHPPAGVEPVAWQCFDCIMEQWSVIDDAELAAARSRRDGEWIVRPLYASPTKAVTITDEMVLADEILAELVHARAKFPGKNVTFAALVEEVGELATATFEESRERVRKEAVQVAVMAMRMVLDGDHTFDSWRAEKGLDPLTAALSSEVQSNG